MSQNRELERATEQYIREVDSANREIISLIKTIKEIEQLAEAVDDVDLRGNFSLKGDVSRLQNEVGELIRNLQTLAREMSDTKSKIFKAIH